MALRLFVGVGLDEAVRAELARSLPLQTPAVEAVPGLRWLAPRNWHLTLQFLGRVQDDALPAVQAACAEAARACSPFAIELGGAGAFKSARRATVLWIGVRAGHERLSALAEALCARTEPLGFAREQREFRSHLTVARLKAPQDVQALLGSLRVPALAMPVAAFTLYRSHVSSRGAEYESLARFALGA